MNDFRPRGFQEAVAQFRDAVRQEGERSENPGLQAILARERRTKGFRSYWTRLAWAAAAVVAMMLAAIPAYQSAQRQKEAAQEQADERLLEQVNAGLSRSVPRAMAPLMEWTPGN